MNLELDHVFILVEPDANVADLLIDLGFHEGERNIHKGQGTSNRRFYFSNGMLEFLWLHDEAEALHGPGRDLQLVGRATNSDASPFGVILVRTDNNDLKMPFSGWIYQPDYFDPPWAFHVGENSNNVNEPLCIYVPFFEPKSRENDIGTGKFKSITHIKLQTKSSELSDVLNVANMSDRLSIQCSNEHLMEITFDKNRCGNSKDLRPDIPLVIHW